MVRSDWREQTAARRLANDDCAIGVNAHDGRAESGTVRTGDTLRAPRFAIHVSDQAVGGAEIYADGSSHLCFLPNDHDYFMTAFTGRLLRSQLFRDFVHQIADVGAAIQDFVHARHEGLLRGFAISGDQWFHPIRQKPERARHPLQKVFLRNRRTLRADAG